MTMVLDAKRKSEGARDNRGEGYVSLGKSKEVVLVFKSTSPIRKKKWRGRKEKKRQTGGSKKFRRDEKKK